MESGNFLPEYQEESVEKPALFMDGLSERQEKEPLRNWYTAGW